MAADKFSCFATVDGPHVERVTEDEGHVLFGTQIGKPVPGEHALAADHQAVAIGLDQSQERFWPGRNVLVNNDLVGGIENADVHGAGMQIDTAVKAVLFGFWLFPKD